MRTRAAVAFALEAVEPKMRKQLEKRPNGKGDIDSVGANFTPTEKKFVQV